MESARLYGTFSHVTIKHMCELSGHDRAKPSHCFASCDSLRLFSRAVRVFAAQSLENSLMPPELTGVENGLKCTKIWFAPAAAVCLN